MKRFTWISLPMLLALLAAAVVMGPNETAAKGKDAVAMSAADLKWEPMANVPGVSVALVSGMMNKGAYSAFVKLPANDNHPLHTHSKEIKAIVLSGTFKYQPEGGAEVALGPGSYLMIPAGLKHISSTGDTECVLYQEQSGAFDMKMVAAQSK